MKTSGNINLISDVKINKIKESLIIDEKPESVDQKFLQNNIEIKNMMEEYKKEKEELSQVGANIVG